MQIIVITEFSHHYLLNNFFLKEIGVYLFIYGYIIQHEYPSSLIRN